MSQKMTSVPSQRPSHLTSFWYDTMSLAASVNYVPLE